MPRAKTKPKPPPNAAPAPAAVPRTLGEATEVLTLAEAAAYLRVPEAEVVRLVRQQDLPGSCLGPSGGS
jgi:hypothetical protein